MEIDKEIVGSLTYRGVLAYVACLTLGDGSWTSAQLAQSVACNSSLMLEGLHELHTARPEIVGKQHGFKWPVGSGVASTEQVQILDSKASRRTDFLDDVKKMFEWANRDKDDPNSFLAFTMNAADGIAVQRWLKQHPEVTQEQWRLCLKHRFTSEKIVKSQGLAFWVPRLLEYLEGRKDQYGKLMVNGGGKLGNAITTELGNNAARRAAVAAAGINA